MLNTIETTTLFNMSTTQLKQNSARALKKILKPTDVSIHFDKYHFVTQQVSVQVFYPTLNSFVIVEVDTKVVERFLDSNIFDTNNEFYQALDLNKSISKVILLTNTFDIIPKQDDLLSNVVRILANQQLEQDISLEVKAKNILSLVYQFGMKVEEQDDTLLAAIEDSLSK